MKPKEKAENLIQQFSFKIKDCKNTQSQAKECALIAVNEILNANPTWFIDPTKSTHQYWEAVKENLNKIELKGILTIHSIVAILPTEEQIEKRAETWCDKYAESWNAQNSAYIEGMTAIINDLKELTKDNYCQ